MRIRTGYSFRTAVGSVENVMSRVKELGWDAAPISDRASTFGYVKWRKEAKKAGLRPVYGVELGVTDSLSAKKPAIDHWTFWAIDDLKYLNLLVEKATNQFRYEPLLSYEQAWAAEGVFKMTGHRTLLDKVPLRDDVFVSLAPSTPRGLFKKAKEAGHKFIACSDNHFARPEDKGLYEVLCGRNSSTQTYPQYILTDTEWLEALQWCDPAELGMAVANRNMLMGFSKATLRQGELLHPEKPMSLRELCIEGAKIVGCDLTRPVYAARLDRELSLIAEKQYEDYFYIISDVMRWARKEMICGPARGSSCGSLVCYLLQITTIDPIPYNLIFERFIDTTRTDLPDIDLDFSDERRHLVFEYMEAKYGKERVARLGTVALYKPRSAIAEAGAALDIPRWRTDKVLDSLIERSGGDSRALQVMEDTFNDTEAGKALILEYPELKIAQAMEGHPRHSSQHAAGIVLTERPVVDYIAIDSRTGATQCDKKDAEELNLLKIDALGLTQLSVFEETLQMAGLPMDHLEKVPPDDQAAFDIINNGKFAGIFQYNGVALQSIAGQIRTNEIEDIIATTALARPGPLASGGTNEWVKRKNGLSPTVYPHKEFEPHLRNTLGIVAYQEQVMSIGREIGDLSWDDVTMLRKAMSKSLGKEFFDQYGDRFKAGARKKFNGAIPDETLVKVWDDLCAYGAWAFNRSHSVAYGIVSYWCCYLKAHHPFEFAAATLQHETDPVKQITLLREMHKEGIDYVPVNKDKSTNRWQPAIIDGKRVLLGPVQNVKGIGPKMVSSIMSARQRGDKLPSRAAKLLENPVTSIDSLWPVRDKIKEVLPDPATANILSPVTSVIDVQVKGFDYEVMIFAVAKQIKPRDENEPQVVAKRGYKVKSPTQALNLFMSDDTDTIFCKISRFDYERIGREIVERGLPGKAIYAIKGMVPADFRMIRVKAVRYIGLMDGPKAKQSGGINSYSKDRTAGGIAEDAP